MVDRPSGPRPRARSWLRGIAVATSIGVPFGVLVSFGALAGQYVDERTGRRFFTVLGVVLGAIAAFVNMLRILKHFQRSAEAPRATDRRDRP